MENTTPSEWQEDENGKRYRMIGNIKEYEMVVQFDGCQVPESRLEEFKRRRKEAAQQQQQHRLQEASERTKLPQYNCPLNHNGLNSTCRHNDCIFFNGKNCIVREAGTDPTASEGKRCPLDIYNRVCNSKCAFNKGGCILPGIISNLSQKGSTKNE